MNLANLPHQLFLPTVAVAHAATLQADDADGWVYVVRHDPSGRGLSFIEVLDESGAPIGRV